jgi:hypothetical protein
MRRPEWEWRAAGTGVGREAGGRWRHGQPATWAARDGGVDGAGGVTAEWSGRPDDFDLYLRRRGRPGSRHRTSSPSNRDFLFLYLFIRWGIEEDHCVVKNKILGFFAK